ncbi:MAG: hypothetical protein R2747_24660 [Pyrinomonadaceae bacterium]
MPKNKNLSNLLPLMLFIISLSLACNSGSKPTDTPEAPTDQPKVKTGDPADGNKTYQTKVKVKTPDDKDVVEVKIDSDPKIEFGGKVLRGETKGEKRKYTLEGGSQTAEVKAGGADGFKVRTNDGKLLWKVKISADKIKISDNEENENAFEIKKRDDGAKIERNENKLGEVKFYRDRGKVKVKDASDKELFDSNTEKYSVAYGVLALGEIPEEYRFIIFAELLSRNV